MNRRTFFKTIAAALAAAVVPVAAPARRGVSIIHRPDLLALQRKAWYVQQLHRYNAALAADYVIPFRVIADPARPSAEVAALFAKRRKALS